jgi:hypothetical protein
MRLVTILASAAIATMAIAPAIAGPLNPAASLSLSAKTVRANAPVKKSNKLAGSALLIAGLAAAGVVAGAVALSHHDSKSASS